MTINRFQLVNRHNPEIKEIDVFSPLSVGNGEFAFSADITGLQSFPEAYRESMSLCTQSQWGWHTLPAPEGVDPKEYRFKMHDTYGRKVPYASNHKEQKEIYDWMRQNPHRLHLGQIGLRMLGSDGRRIEIGEIQGIFQKLDLWSGILLSRFTVEGIPVQVKTLCHPIRDQLAVSVESPLIEAGRLSIDFDFPYGSHEKHAADWSRMDRHSTEKIGGSSHQIQWLRVLDHDRYFVTAAFSRKVIVTQREKNRFTCKPEEKTDRISFVTGFSPLFMREELSSYEAVEEASIKHWEGFWTEGGAIELAESKDPRAWELEKRIVLSQYLTAIQCAGTIPPQETGLTCNSWYGKPHLEMHFWHAAHFPLWGRTPLLERSLWWYKSILGKALEIAQMQGYEGVRWPKMVDAEGNNSPSPIAPLLIWQQPHPIYFAELCYRAQPDEETLETYKDIVFHTAEFMASFAHYDEEKDRFVLGPPVIPAQENHKPEETLNPTYELEYWVFGLHTAQEWKKRLGLPLEEKWEEIITKISRLPESEGVYLAHEKCAKTFTEFNVDHPSMLGAYGILPGKLADKETMRRTLHRVMKDWTWERTWGWDYPMVAMTAARLGEGDLAIDALLMDAPKNTYLTNGHNRQVTRKDLPLYLPGNGGLLLAVAMMAAGWDGGPEREAPGFPADGSWVVRWEGLSPMP